MARLRILDARPEAGLPNGPLRHLSQLRPYRLHVHVVLLLPRHEVSYSDLLKDVKFVILRREYYRVFHLLVHLGGVDFDLGVPSSCPAAQPLLPNSHQPKQSRADSGTLEIQVNKTQSPLTWDTL